MFVVSRAWLGHSALGQWVDSMKVHSYWVKLHVLREFELRSGLAVSVQKSSFFASGITEAETDLIKFSTGMPMGTLPVRYLGVPLCTKKLSLLNCEGLLQQIKSRLSSWSAKSLSFAGRLLLIKTVITGITTFWCSTFILSQACVKRINSLCGVFLWQGDIEQHHTARVSWKVVTKPKGKEVWELKTSPSGTRRVASSLSGSCSSSQVRCGLLGSRQRC